MAYTDPRAELKTFKQWFERQEGQMVSAYGYSMPGYRWSLVPVESYIDNFRRNFTYPCYYDPSYITTGGVVPDQVADEAELRGVVLMTETAPWPFWAATIGVMLLGVFGVLAVVKLCRRDYRWQSGIALRVRLEKTAAKQKAKAARAQDREEMEELSRAPLKGKRRKKEEGSDGFIVAAREDSSDRRSGRRVARSEDSRSHVTEVEEIQLAEIAEITEERPSAVVATDVSSVSHDSTSADMMIRMQAAALQQQEQALEQARQLAQEQAMQMAQQQMAAMYGMQSVYGMEPVPHGFTSGYVSNPVGSLDVVTEPTTATAGGEAKADEVMAFLAKGEQPLGDLDAVQTEDILALAQLDTELQKVLQEDAAKAMGK